METVIIVIHLMVVISMVAIVLLQRSEGGALGIGGGGGGGGGGLFSSRGTANVLTRATAILALAFFSTSIAMTILARTGDTPSSVLDTASQSEASPTTGDKKATDGKGLLDQLKKQSSPSGPAVPSSQ